jgi:hypothetical protein
MGGSELVEGTLQRELPIQSEELASGILPAFQQLGIAEPDGVIRHLVLG